MIRNIVFTRDGTAALDTQYVERIFAELVASHEEAREAQGTVALTFPDYEDTEPVYAAPDVRDFLVALHERIPYLFYLLSDAEEVGSLMAFLSAHSPPEATRIDDDGVEVAAAKEAIVELFEAMSRTAAFAVHVGDDPERVVARMVAPLGEDMQSRIVEGALEAARA